MMKKENNKKQDKEIVNNPEKGPFSGSFTLFLSSFLFDILFFSFTIFKKL